MKENIEIGSGSYKNLDDILKFKNDHWHIAKVISKNSNLIELLIINSDEIINLKVENNLYGPKKVSPNNYLNLNDYIFVTNIERFFLCSSVT